MDIIFSGFDHQYISCPCLHNLHCRLRVMMDHTCFKNLFILLGLETLKLSMIKKMLHS